MSEVDLVEALAGLRGNLGRSRTSDEVDEVVALAIQLADEVEELRGFRDLNHNLHFQCEQHGKRNARLREALDDMVNQFAESNDRGEYHTSGLSALEGAFDVLGWDDPHPMPAELLCDVLGCNRRSTCGWNSTAGYRRTCGGCYRILAPALHTDGETVPEVSPDDKT